MGLEKLFDIILQIWDSLIPWTVNDAYEGGVVLRFGRYSRPAPSGFILHFPFRIEKVLACNTAIQTTTILTFPQILKDGIKVACRVILQWQVVDPKKYLLDIEGGEAFIVEAAGPIVTKALKASTWEEASHPDFNEAITKAVRKRAWKWGCEILEVNFLVLTPLSLKEGNVFVSLTGSTAY